MNIYPVQEVRKGINISPYPLYAPCGYKDKQKVNRIFTQTTLFKVVKKNNYCES
jgi:hypothetical protein